VISHWPTEETLTNVTDSRIDGGGPAHNVAMDLTRLGAPFPVLGMGAVGDDDAGRFLLNACRNRGINTDHIRVLSGIHTSQTDVMTVRATGKRTFFHQQGANARLSPGDFEFSNIPSRILHLGAPGIHQRLDQACPDYANGWVAVLAKARQAGLKTNLELVSSKPEEIRRLGNPCLALLDTLIINDYEAGAMTGLRVVDDGRVSAAEASKAACMLLDRGVRDLVVVHFPEGCVAASRDGQTVSHPSLRVPQEAINSGNGAGDAFAAGVLYGLHEQWPLEDSLVLGHCSAASALRSVSATAAVGSVAECLALPAQWEWRSDL
jgi:sugar/nucleoside kinase (ribokinase family)